MNDFLSDKTINRSADKARASKGPNKCVICGFPIVNRKRKNATMCQACKIDEACKKQKRKKYKKERAAKLAKQLCD